MPGFLLADDAIGARKQVFDDWIGEQKRNAEQAAQQAAQAAQAAAQQHASEVAARAQQFQDWVGQQAVSPTAPAAPQQPTAPAVEPQVVSAPPPAVGPLTQPTSPSTPEAQDRASKFQDWITQQTQQAVQPQPQPDLGAPAQAAPSPAQAAQQTGQAPQAPTADDPMRKAAPFLGEQYVWGGKSPQQGFDCSGFAGYLTTGQPESTTTLYGKSAAIDPNALQSGDLVFYNMGQDDMHLQHVGVYIGNGKLVQQGGSERQVNVADVNQAVGSAPEFRRLNAGQVQQTAGAPAQAVGRGGGGGGAGGFTDQTTAGISGGGARSGQMGDQGQQILSGAADAASWLGNDGQKALQSILVTEGGLAGARGDSGRSAGPLQFFEGGQLGNFARAFQMSLEEAKTYVEQHPLEAIRWAIGVPSNPGYLGAAIVSGLQRNLSGPDLATYAQRTGQVSESPERAGDNYRNLFGQGQDVVRGTGTAVEGALEAGRQVFSRAGDVAAQGQQLVQQGAQGARDAWSQFDNAQTQRQADNQRWFDEQRSRLEAQSTERQQQGAEFTRSMADQMRQFRENEGFTAPGGPVGQAFSGLGSATQDALGRLGEGLPGLSEADRATRRQALEESPLGQLYGSDIRKQLLPNITEAGHPLNVLGDLQEKYRDPSDPTGLRVTERMTPDDRAAYENAMLGVGGTVGSVGIEQKVLQELRAGGLMRGTRVPPPPPPGSPLREQWLQDAGPWAPAPERGPIAQAVDLTKQSILSNPATHIANVIGNTIELARGPAALALGGRFSDAGAATAAIGHALPEAAANAMSAIRGNQVATLAGQGSVIPARAPIFRALSASDAFTRTLGEYQGMAAEASRLLRESGMKASDPQAADFLASHAADLYRAGAREGAQSVFGQAGSSAVANRNALEKAFNRYSSYKEQLLNSPSLKAQGAGALMDFMVPFSGVPVRMLEIAGKRLPVTSQAYGVYKMLSAGSRAEAQRAFGNMSLETMTQALIAKHIADGNITGPDDPDHPSSVRIGGNWVGMGEMGGYSLPMQIMASFAEGYEKGGREVPAGAGWVEAMGPRGAAALNASLKPFQHAIPGENMLRLVSNIGQGGATAGALGLAQDAVNRVTVPGAARFVENLTDPVARDFNRKGVESLWEGPVSNWPGLAKFLPAKIDPTTGDALQKVRTGPGILLGGQQDVESAITKEAHRLKKAGYEISPPTDKPSSVSVYGMTVPVKDASTEQRAMVKARGQLLAEIGQQMNQPSYARMSNDQKAQMWSSLIDRSAKVQAGAWLQSVDPETAGRILSRGRPIAGRAQDMDETERINQQVAQTNLIRRQQQAMARA